MPAGRDRRPQLNVCPPGGLETERPEQTSSQERAKTTKNDVLSKYKNAYVVCTI